MSLTWQGALVANFAAIIFGVYRVGVYVGHVKGVVARLHAMEVSLQQQVTTDDIALESSKQLLELQKVKADLIQLMSTGRHGMRNEMQVALGETAEQLEDKIVELRESTNTRIGELRDEIKTIMERIHQRKR